jgi:uncharacterized protein (DUF427 family)
MSATASSRPEPESAAPRSRRMLDAWAALLGELRYEPIRSRLRALIGEEAVLDSTRALVVWEPRRVVPSFAVPAADVSGELVPAATGPEPAPGEGVPVGPYVVLDPSIPFSVHSTPGTALDLRTAERTLAGAAFRPDDPDLADHVVLDFDAFDAWYQEDQRVVAHARDPFSRIEVLPTSRPVRVELDGEVLAESRRAVLLVEGPVLPVRAYLPPEDVRVPLQPSPTRTWCAYKGEARYWSAELGDRTLPDVAWSYEHPLRDAAGVDGRIAFLNERVDVIVDGERPERPRTPWS